MDYLLCLPKVYSGAFDLREPSIRVRGLWGSRVTTKSSTDLLSECGTSEAAESLESVCEFWTSRRAVTSSPAGSRCLRLSLS